jgi:hypothetical protein
MKLLTRTGILTLLKARLRSSGCSHDLGSKIDSAVSVGDVCREIGRNLKRAAEDRVWVGREAGFGAEALCNDCIIGNGSMG